MRRKKMQSPELAVDNDSALVEIDARNLKHLSSIIQDRLKIKDDSDERMLCMLLGPLLARASIDMAQT